MPLLSLCREISLYGDRFLGLNGVSHCLSPGIWPVHPKLWAVENGNSPRGNRGKIEQLHGRPTADIFEWVIAMSRRNIYAIALAVVLIAVIVSVDLLFFRHHFWERLMANIGIVLVFVAFGLIFLRKP